ncbi:MAG: 4-(cytidine 5'-diphospho)-2-C-methyl-D-erythritol kinase [Succinivibrionaceae bacterium]
MGTITTWPSPAKINLFLHINGKRSDGYHELQTIFYILNKGDELTFETHDDSNTEINILPDLGFPKEENIVYKAILALREYTRIQKGITVTINKKIPMGGGLGGGSSNAATTLVALNCIWNLGLSDDILATIGRKLGADVPVFVKGHSAFAEGVGEILEPVDVPNKYFLVVTPDNTHISTKEIFTNSDLPRNTPKINKNNSSFENTHNDCEKLVKNLNSNVAKTLSWLLKYAPSRMTGTGASCFGIFDDEKSAMMAYNDMPNDIHGFVAQACAISPLKTFAHNYIQTL